MVHFGAQLTSSFRTRLLCNVLSTTRMADCGHYQRRPVAAAEQSRKSRHEEDDMSSYQWILSDDRIEQANVTWLARAHGLADRRELRAHSVADTAWFWDAVRSDRGLCRGTRRFGAWKLIEVQRRGGL